MLSYQWADQQTVMKIRDRIKGHGYKVSKTDRFFKTVGETP